MRLEIQRPELVQAEHRLGFTVLGYDLADGDRVQELDAGFLGRIVRVAENLHALKGDTFPAEQDAQALVADVINHPLSDQEVGHLGQAPGRKRQAVLSRPGLGDLPNLTQRSGSVKVFGRPPLYFGYRESKPSALKLWITSQPQPSLPNVTSAIFATAIPWADSSTICAHHQVTTDPVPRQTILNSRSPSSSSTSPTRTRSATPTA